MQTKPFLWFEGISSAIPCSIAQKHRPDPVISALFCGDAPFCGAIPWFNTDFVHFSRLAVFHQEQKPPFFFKCTNEQFASNQSGILKPEWPSQSYRQTFSLILFIELQSVISIFTHNFCLSYNSIQNILLCVCFQCYKQANKHVIYLRWVCHKERKYYLV